MSLTIQVSGAGNAYAQQVMNEVRGNPVGGEVPHADEQIGNGPAENERPADGVLMRALRQIRREAGPSHAGLLAGAVIEKSVNLNLDHADEVDGGAATRAMDEDWVDVDFVSDVIKDHDGGNDSADLRAQRTMAALEQMKVSDIRGAFAGVLWGVQGDAERAESVRNVLTTGAGEGVLGQLADAVKAQRQLGERLFIACHNMDEPDTGLLKTADRSFRCAESLISLVTNIAMSQDNAGAPGANQENVVEALAREMLPESERAVRENTERAVGVIDEQLADLNRLYGELKGRSESVTAVEYQELAQGLAKAKQMLLDARDGIELRDAETGETRRLGNPDESVLRQLEAKVDRMAADVARLRDEALDDALKVVRDGMSLDLVDSHFFDDRWIDHFCDDDAEAAGQVKSAVARLRTDVQRLKTALASCRTTGNADEARNVLMQMSALGAEDGALNLYFSSVNGAGPIFPIVRNLPPLSMDELQKVTLNLKRLLDGKTVVALVDRFEDMVKRTRVKGVPLVDGGLLTGVLDGTCGVATAAFAGAWGVSPSSLVPGIDDRYLASSRMLGQGRFNSVSLCSYRQTDGQVVRRVFKPEIPARCGLEKGGLSGGLPYAPLQQVTTINVAVSNMAKLLGVKECVVQAHPGVHNGQFGLMMELADGVSCDDIMNAVNGTKNMNAIQVGQKSLKELKDIVGDGGINARTVLGNLRHSLSDLNWLDCIVGQNDRNDGNYMISIGDDLSVAVKGIDNDLCFSPIVETVFPSVISRQCFEKLETAVGKLEALESDSERRAWLREQLGITDLTDAQIDKTVERLKAGLAHARSEACETIGSDGDWLDLESLRAQVQSNCSDDLFVRGFIKNDMLGLQFSANDPFVELRDEKCRMQRLQHRRVQAAINGVDLAGLLAQAAANADPTVSESEFRAFYEHFITTPSNSSGLVEWDSNPSDEDIRAALIEKCKTFKRRLESMIAAGHPELDGPFVESFRPAYYQNGCGATDGEAKGFVKCLDVFAKHFSADDVVVVKMLGNSGKLKWMPFVRDCVEKLKFKVDAVTVAEALSVELKQLGQDLDNLRVDTLRRLVVNKFKVTPMQVFGRDVQLNGQDLANFRQACAVTPSGAEYYANVKAKYDELKG